MLNIHKNCCVCKIIEVPLRPKKAVIALAYGYQYAETERFGFSAERWKLILFLCVSIAVRWQENQCKNKQVYKHYY